jgi:hypothetical protein
MSEARRRLASKGALRLTAWSSAAAALLASWAVLGALPKPVAPVAARADVPDVLVIRKVLRRVVVHAAAPVAPAPPTVTFDPGGSSLPPPATSTGGS